MSAISATGLVKRFDGVTVLNGVDLTVSPGEVVAIIGPSGSGKSTLLRCLAGLETPDAGDLTVAGVTASGKVAFTRALKGRVGFVFQSFNLFPHRTAAQNVAEGPVVVRGENPPPPWRRPRPCSPRSAWATGSTPIPASSPAASSSAAPSPAPWPWIRGSSCSTNPPRRWTRNWSARC
jgi:hypothetical protein